MSHILSVPNHGADVEATIAFGVNHGRFVPETRVSLFEASSTRTHWEDNLNDEGLARKLDEFTSGPQGIVKNRTFFLLSTQPSDQLMISPLILSRLCSLIYVPVMFIERILDIARWAPRGNGLFLHQNKDGRPSRLEVFYGYISALEKGYAWVFTQYDFANKITTNICINPGVEAQLEYVKKLRDPRAVFSVEQPLALHIVIASGTLHSWNKQADNARSRLLEEERGFVDTNPKATTIMLHDLANLLHVYEEHFNELEHRTAYLIKVSSIISDATISPSMPGTSINDIYMLEFLLSGCQSSKRLIVSCRNRVNIRINLAFHLSTQMDSELNMQISKATTAIARDAQRDSSSMITIAAVTMFFLPGTFISAVFSMVFFNISPDLDGNLQFLVYDRWWYFLAATIPTTLIVFVVWVVWQRIRFRNHEMESNTREASAKSS